MCSQCLISPMNLFSQLYIYVTTLCFHILIFICIILCFFLFNFCFCSLSHVQTLLNLIFVNAKFSCSFINFTPCVINLCFKFILIFLFVLCLFIGSKRYMERQCIFTKILVINMRIIFYIAYGLWFVYFLNLWWAPRVECIEFKGIDNFSNSFGHST